MTKVLGRVIPAMDRPRGPDAKLCVCVPERWITEGATIEVELPRNLSCAVCDGGGCDACGRSGAVSLRGRKEPPELVGVVLPAKDWERSRVGGGVLLRLPDRGGLPATDSDLPRGNLLIMIRAGTEPDRFVTRLVAEPAPISAAASAKSRRVAIYAALAVCAATVFWWLLFR